VDKPRLNDFSGLSGIYNNKKVQTRTNSTYVPFQILPFVSANNNSFRSYFQVQEWIGTEIHLHPVDRGWTLANKILMSLKIDFPLTKFTCKQTFDTLN